MHPGTSRSSGDLLAPSDLPPAGLAPGEVPQFVVLACDDNPHVDSMRWIIEFLEHRRNPAGALQSATFDSCPARLTFFSCGMYLDWKPELRALHRLAFEQGHEIGNHSQTHPKGEAFSVEQWLHEMSACQTAIIRSGIPAESVRGFRTPYLEVSANVFEAQRLMGFSYDASIEEGFQHGMTGAGYLWPYTLDAGSPGNEWLASLGVRRAIGKHPGLWHVANNYVIVPPDEVSERYEFRPGLRQRVHESIMRREGWSWDRDYGKLTGLDHNMWNSAELASHEVLATMKYTLDLRLTGNRSPFLFGAHVECNPDTEAGKRAAVEAFVDYALSQPAVRIVPAINVVEWMRAPRALTATVAAGRA
jgi:hypothetical protein